MVVINPTFSRHEKINKDKYYKPNDYLKTTKLATIMSLF